MDPQQQLFGLMAVAQEQQAAVKAALDALAAERGAYGKERAALGQIAQQASLAADAMRRAAAEAVPGVQAAVSTAVATSVAQQMEGASATAGTALAKACAPVVKNLGAAAKAAGEAEGQLTEAAASIKSRVLGIVIAAAVVGCAVIYGGAWLMVQWVQYEVSSARKDRDAAIAEKAEMQATLDMLRDAGGDAIVKTCGGRPCIAVETPSQYTDTTTGAPLYYIIRRIKKGR